MLPLPGSSLCGFTSTGPKVPATTVVKPWLNCTEPSDRLRIPVRQWILRRETSASGIFGLRTQGDDLGKLERFLCITVPQHSENNDRKPLKFDGKKVGAKFFCNVLKDFECK
jgi:hypothetical protein